MPQLDLVLPAPPRVAPRVAGVPANRRAEAQQLVLVVRAQGDAGRVAPHLEIGELGPGPAVVADPRANLGRELVARLLEATQLVWPRVARAVEVEGPVVAPDPGPGNPAPLLLEVAEVDARGGGQVPAGEVARRDAHAPREAVLLGVHIREDGEPGRHLLEREDEAHPVVAHGLAVHPDLREDRQVVEPRHVAIHRLDLEGIAHFRADLARDDPVLRDVVPGDVDRGHAAPREGREAGRGSAPDADLPIREHLRADRCRPQGEQEERCPDGRPRPQVAGACLLRAAGVARAPCVVVMGLPGHGRLPDPLLVDRHADRAQHSSLDFFEQPGGE